MFCLVGCVTEKERNTIISELIKHNYLSKEWERVDYFEHDDSGSDVPIPISYNYAFKDKNNKYYALIIKNNSSNEEYDLIIYYDVIYEPNRNVSYNRVYYDMKTTENTRKINLKMKQKNFLFIKYWTFEEIK